jgi:exosortase/archaeosortase family protein
MVQFFVVFVTIVLTLLLGHRYAIHTYANDWYLFQVGKHTAWLLDKTGDYADLEGETAQGLRAQQRRASIDAWDRGENAPSAEDIAAASPVSLTPWESFRFRIGSYLRVHDPAEVRALVKAWEEGRDTATREEIAAQPGDPLRFGERYQYRRLYGQRNTQTTGPRVWFVFNRGLETEMRDLTTTLQEARLNADMEGRPAEEAAKIDTAALEARLEEIRGLIAEEKAKRQPAAEVLGRYFVFIIVPECGAIEVMAIFLAAVVAFPAGIRKKLLGLLLGLPVMYLVNVFRLSCLAIIGALDGTKGRWVFNFAHEYVWQTIYIVFVVAVWLLWVEYVVRRKNSHG